MKLRITYLAIAAIVSFLFGALSRGEERFALSEQKADCLGCHTGK